MGITVYISVHDSVEFMTQQLLQFITQCVEYRIFIDIDTFDKTHGDYLTATASK